MAALHRAVALPEVHEVAVRVAEDLHLDVLRARRCSARGTRPARPNAAPASRCASASLAASSVGAVHDAHAAAAAAEARLDHQRVADARGFRRDVGRVCDARARCPESSARRPRRASRLAAVLSPNMSSCSGVGPTNWMPAASHAARERRVLGEEAVAGMDGVDALLLGDRDDARRCSGTSGPARRPAAAR